MARRRSTRKAPRRSKAISALNVFESYMYANILTQGSLGSSPLEFLTGADDLGETSFITGYSQGALQYGTAIQGAGQISLRDMISQPSLALATVQSNVMNNYQSMFIQSVSTRLAFKFGKKLLRAPISSVNRNLMRPLGIGIKL